MTLQFDPTRLVWNRFDALEAPDLAWADDIPYWEGFNAAFFAANGRAYSPERDSNVATWVRAEDRASFTDMIAALAPRIADQDLEAVDMVILAHWLPDLHLGSSVTNFAMHRLELTDCLGFAISDRGLSAPLFAFDVASRAISSGRCRKVLLLVMDQKNLLYRDPAIAALAPENVAAAMLLGPGTPGLAYRGYARRTGLADANLTDVIAELRAVFGLGAEAALIGPSALAAAAPGLIPTQDSLVCAAPFVALADCPPNRDAMLLTWQFGTLTALGFSAQGGQDAA